LGFELLKNRALGFPRDARMDFENRDYDLVLFHIEQFAQLYSKYLLYKRIGDYPKTHSLLRLLSNLARIYGDCGLRDFIDNYLKGLYLLEEAYMNTLHAACI